MFLKRPPPSRRDSLTVALERPLNIARRGSFSKQGECTSIAWRQARRKLAVRIVIQFFEE